MSAEPAPLKAMRVAARAVGSARQQRRRVTVLTGQLGFPFRRPTVPRGVAMPPRKKRTGADYDTAWARSPVARATRVLVVEGPLRLAVKVAADPEIVGRDRLQDLIDTHRRADPKERPAPVIFAANHHSHVDAPLMITSIPEPWRHRLVVGAAADYFFGTRLTGTASALGLGAIPIDRTRVNRRSADLAASLLADRWSILIFPEGGRSPDGWGQPFRGGAAFLSIRTSAPVVPVHIDGAGSIWGKGAKRITPGSTRVTFGSPMHPEPDEDARRFGERIEQAVAALADESLTDWYSARLRAGRGETPSLHGPAATGWRRAWALTEHRAKGKAGERRRQKRRWPKL
jgi:1-acyl-sn-glycerol-3-phosphate acyltransferase